MEGSNERLLAIEDRVNRIDEIEENDEELKAMEEEREKKILADIKKQAEERERMKSALNEQEVYLQDVMKEIEEKEKMLMEALNK
jgi:hypothetical protein